VAHEPRDPPRDDRPAEPSEVDVLDATAEAFRAAVADGDLDRADRIAAALPRRELRDALRGLTPEQTEALYARLGDERLAELLDSLEPEDAGDVLLRLTDAGAADVPERAQPILVEMDRAGDVRELLSYLPDTAGGRMTTEFVAVPPLATAEEAMRVLRAHARDGEVRSYVYATDPAGVLVGVVPLYRLVLVDPATTVADLMVRDPVRVRGTDDQEDVARVFRERRFLAVPVVDVEERLIGVVTADDVADVMEEEATEDIAKLGGSEALDETYPRSGIVDLTKKRIRWLLLLFVAEAYTGTVLRAFENELQAVVALTFFIPLLIGTGGNTGTQITTTLTRALAVGDIRPRDVLFVLRKEWGVAGLLALVMAAASFIRAWTLGVEPRVGTVVAVTAACIVLWAATVASVLPLVLRRLRLDPAVVSGPFITTIVDGTGLIIYFEIARYLLQL
jgi:magnesium transporter